MRRWPHPSPLAGQLVEGGLVQDDFTRAIKGRLLGQCQ
jgi:hypothetical protein